jgi:hypothetical protein
MKSKTKKGVRIEQASVKKLWAMKKKAQARDRALLASGEVTPEAMLLLRPEQLKGAKITWPEAPLNETEDLTHHWCIQSRGNWDSKNMSGVRDEWGYRPYSLRVRESHVFEDQRIAGSFGADTLCGHPCRWTNVHRLNRNGVIHPESV